MDARFVMSREAYVDGIGGRTLAVNNEKCQSVLGNLKRCYTNHLSTQAPQEHCQFYLESTQRACSV